jgi:hypothetical protein
MWTILKIRSKTDIYYFDSRVVVAKKVLAVDNELKLTVTGDQNVHEINLHRFWEF